MKGCFVEKVNVGDVVFIVLICKFGFIKYVFGYDGKNVIRSYKFVKKCLFYMRGVKVFYSFCICYYVIVLFKYW